MTAEKPEGDVALLCHWLRRHRSEGVPIPFAAERAIIVLESQASRIATLTEALQRARGCIQGLLKRTPVRDVAETLGEIDAAIRQSGQAASQP